ncbi:MAG TPA: anthranilate synthase component I [Candidatus Brocadiia bacterium]|nr:anthranilate synthase component I [Candidatus Brocadiia bacterium]
MSQPHYYPSEAEFLDLIGQGNAIPVYRQLMADTLTPVSAFQKLGNQDYAFLLESVTGGEKIGRYSFLGAGPFAGLMAKGRRVEVSYGDNVRTRTSDDPLEDLQKELDRFKVVNVPGLPRFSCGAVGYAAYDSVRYAENLPDAPPDDLQLPDMWFMFYNEMIIFDHINKTLKVICTARTDGKDPKGVYAKARKRIDEIVDKLRTPVMSLSDEIIPTGDVELQYDSNCTREEFRDAVTKAKEYIRAGDIFQVVLSQRLRAKTSAEPFNIYRALRVINPSPYMFFLKMNGVHLVGSSPEVMVKVENRRVTLRPIAGTRRRGKTEAEDAELEKELLADPKERAEHIMLLDLGRNDVGRVAQYGSVSVDECMVIERYSHVMHIVSNVSGTLKEGSTALDALRASLPAGTLSGAPKVRAMQIIDELEPTMRGPYGGTVGYLDFSGNMDTCITIRTVVVKGSTAYVQAGAGIVADSVPDNEYVETINKAKGLLKAIEVAQKM